MTDNGRNRIKDWESLTQSLEKSSESAVLKEPHPYLFYYLLVDYSANGLLKSDLQLSSDPARAGPLPARRASAIAPCIALPPASVQS
jgi:hypothetical protein